MDTVVGRNHKGFLVTMVERKSRYTIFCKVAKKTADEVADAIIRCQSRIAPMVKTLTLDNRREFTQHERVSKALSCKSYFAHPYSSWERGTNENTNGLIRQYLRKRSSVAKVGDKQTTKIMVSLNNRPRKCLDYKTPLEMFSSSAVRRKIALGA